jgi:hypothetical protein
MIQCDYYSLNERYGKESPMSTAENRGPRHPSPPLLAVAIVYTLLFALSLGLSTWMAGGMHYPSPFAAEALASRYFTEHADAVRVGAFLQFGAAVPFGIFTATAVSRLRFLGTEVAGITIALFGGIGASLMLVASALTSWVLSQPGTVDAGTTSHALHLLAFATGGPGHVVLLGLLVAGISIPGGILHLLPRWLTVFGLVIAACAELSALSLLVPQLFFLLPLARLAGFVWMIVVGALLPKSRKARARPANTPESSATPELGLAQGAQ